MSEVELPQGWVKAKVGDYLYLKNGFAFKSNAYIDKTESTYPVIRISDIDGICASDKDAVHVSTPMAGFEVSEGDLLIAMSGATTGKVGVYKGISPAFQNQRVGNLKLHSDKLGCRAYRNYLITALSGDILKVAYGGAQPNISGKAIEDMDIQLPPLAEQQLIANKLDTLLAQVESIKTRLERIPEILKQFRQSVLAAAVSGKLTEEWRGNSDSRIIEEYSKWDWGSGVPINWDVDIYPHLVKSRLGKMLDKQKNEGKPTKYLGNINVRWASFDLENIQEILVSEKEQIELAVQVGDVLICEGGEPGRCAIWKSDYNEPIIFQKALHRARVSDRLLPEWLVFNLKNDADRNTLDQLFTGTTIKHLTGAALKSYPLRVPPINEQKEILNRVNSLFFKADVFEDQVKSALDRVNNLAQSILAKAFRGELTTEWREANPELISGENSAEALLKRIKAERELAKPATRRGRGKS